VGAAVPPDLRSRLEVHCACPKPKHAACQAVLLAAGVTPRFGADSWRVEIPGALLSFPLPGAHPAARTWLVETLTGQLSSLEQREDDFPARVRAAIERGLPLAWNLADVAQSLSLSPRTLQVRLQTMHITFGALLAEVRLEVALRLLETTDLPVRSVAARVGFGSAEAFSRFFRARRAMAPTAHRASARK
jgi:AraC-like DNA-binding protein